MTEQELDALVKPLVWTEESPNCWFGRGSFGYQRDFRVFDGVAKVRIGTIGARVTPDRARSFYDKEYVEFVLEAIDCDAITTLRAQLAEMQETWPLWAAQIKGKLESYGVDPGDEWNVAEQFENWLDEAVEIETATSTARADRAEAALAAQIEADGWQPIETAPTDYTHIIGIDAKGCVARTWFFAPSSLTRDWLRVGLPGKAIWHPTHWKPLHEPDAQPHDRTALDAVRRAAKVEAWKEAALTAVRSVRRWRPRTHGPYGMNEDANGGHVKIADVEAAILALIGEGV